MANLLSKFINKITSSSNIPTEYKNDYKINIKESENVTLTRNRIHICSVINGQIDIIDMLNKLINENNQHKNRIIECEKKLLKVKKIKELSKEEKRIVLEFEQEVNENKNKLELLNEEINKVNNQLDEFKKNNLSIDKLNKLLKFIESDCGVLFSDKHINTYMSIPNLKSKDKEIFETFVKSYNFLISEKQFNESLERQKKEQLRLKELERLKQFKNETLVRKEVNDDFFEIYDNEIEEITSYELNKKSVVLFNNFLNGNEFNDIKTLFPKISDSGYYNIKNDLITLLTSKIEEFYIEIEDNQHKDFNLVTKYERHLDQVCDYFDKEELEKFDNEVEKSDRANVFFAVSPSGKPYIINDFEQFEKEKKEDVLKLINTLKTTKFSTNPTKQKKLKNNKSLKGIFELKKPNVRVVYKELGYNNYYVLMAFKKNTLTDKEFANSILLRSRICQKHFDYIKNNILNINFINELIASDKEIVENLTNSIIDEKNISF